MCEWQLIDLGSMLLVSIHIIKMGKAGFSDVKSITLSTLKLVDKVHRLAVSMGSYGVSEVNTGAVEHVGGMVNGTNLASVSIAVSGASGGGRTMGSRLV